ncbi:MAG: acyl-CoA dehydrogenase C-terminal domain-containing protein [Xanthomonadales bacterium]|nr:3-methylmercaptopropionyl-CoA dehydrogenase [Xanthomonadales bacterium]MCC6593200.1 acyl-CoA dehydrogenase C-terminal domain-containing protein [Xanthomonadales bacterium]MCE7930700.1 acyl-CoA dehydrogenase [Xanthomonadales bacterium PRO6]
MKYTAPQTDMRFVLFDVFEATALYAALPGGEQHGRELIEAILEEGAKFCEQVLAPTNAIGDSEGCHYDQASQSVTTPKAFREAYDRFVEGGWTGLCGDPAYGGQGMPESVGYVFKEMIESANVAWGTYPLLSAGAVDALTHHGEQWQREVFIPRILSGDWTGTMCLTEPHCGSDLGLLRTRAEPTADGSYRISGTKIFITAGDHDLSKNIVHLVLARLPDAPAGTRGISMFIVPKYQVARDGSVGERNPVAAGSIEHKMGLKGSATCVMNFDGAEGFMIGQPNRGLAAMFTMMNTARLGVGVQGLGLIEVSHQNALAYAKDRLQMRSLSGPKRPDKPADPIIVHPDVRRMLMTQKACAEAGRALCIYSALQVDLVSRHPDASVRQRADELLSFLTPISKAMLTELAIECTSHGVQILGGHGYIHEWGLEQFLRDARITSIYEGTTQIQALDLLGRKIMGQQAVGLRHFLGEIGSFCTAQAANAVIAPWVTSVARHAQDWEVLTREIGTRAAQNAEEIGAAAVDYLFYSGYVSFAYLLAREAEAVTRASYTGTAEFRDAKLATVGFYFDRLLPRTLTHAAGVRAGAASLTTAVEAALV